MDFQPGNLYALTCTCGCTEMRVESASMTNPYFGWRTTLTCIGCGTVSTSYLVTEDGRHWMTGAVDQGTLKVGVQ